MESIGNLHKSLKATLDEKKNNRRVLLLYGRDDAQHYIIDQQEQLHAADAQLSQHDLDVVVLIASTTVEPDRWYLMHTEGFNLIPSEDFIGWLIDKDGSLKHRFTQPLSPDELLKHV